MQFFNQKQENLNKNMYKITIESLENKEVIAEMESDGYAIAIPRKDNEGLEIAIQPLRDRVENLYFCICFYEAWSLFVKQQFKQDHPYYDIANKTYQMLQNLHDNESIPTKKEIN